MTKAEEIKFRHSIIAKALSEKVYRRYLASEAQLIGWGGISLVASATGASPNTIRCGLAELSEEMLGQQCDEHAANKDVMQSDMEAQIPSKVNEPRASSENIANGTAPASKKRQRRRGGRKPVSEAQRQRKPGGGRKRQTSLDPTLKSDLESLLEPFAAGDPCSPLRWTCKSIASLTEELVKMGHKTSTRMVHELLVEMGYTMQANKKTKDSGNHVDRNDQFLYINAQAESFMAEGQPVISVDTKKKELVGDFANKGSTWRPAGCPESVNVHDFMDPDKGRASPYGIYDTAANQGFVNVGTSADTSEFAVESIRRWWKDMGMERYPEASKLYITADGGGSNGSRVHLWKAQLQKLADETRLEITVSHYPPGTSKWNKIEHRMFAYISQNWRGRPLVSIETIVKLIGSSKTKTGLKINATVDINKYETGIKVPQEEMAALEITRNAFHGEWNYTILPRTI